MDLIDIVAALLFIVIILLLLGISRVALNMLDKIAMKKKNNNSPEVDLNSLKRVIWPWSKS